MDIKITITKTLTDQDWHFTELVERTETQEELGQELYALLITELTDCSSEEFMEDADVTFEAL